MDDNEKRLSQLANQYNELISQVQLPEMRVEDLLDLVDYYSRAGMDFEAELYKRIAMMKFPTHPDVLLMCAHWEADLGNWLGVKAISSALEMSKYDEALFAIEKALRYMKPEEAMAKVEATVSPLLEMADQDFLFDAAELFRDFGYMNEALDCMKRIPTSYRDYNQVYEVLAECYYYQARFDEALEALDKAIDANPFDDYLWVQTGLVHYKKGDFAKALDACEYSLAIQKENPRAEQLKLILKHHQNDHFSIAANAFHRQDYAGMMEAGDLDFGCKAYADAGMNYMVAGYFCPRGNRDRVQIACKTAKARVMNHQVEKGIETLLSVINQGADLWPYAFELMVLLLKTGNLQAVPALLLPLMRLEKLTVLRLEQLTLELSSAHCFAEAKEVWEMIFEREQELLPVYLHFLEDARKEIGGAGAGAAAE